MQTHKTFAQLIEKAPKKPGCYLMRDQYGQVFYVGKAINLYNRLKSYASGQDTRAFVSWLHEVLWDIEWIVVQNETEALLLERTLILKHQPKYNILLKDDKNYILLQLKPISHAPADKRSKRYPKLEVVRKKGEEKATYFGPYPSASQLRLSLNMINKLFQLRPCKDSMIDSRKRPCIQYQIGRCKAPCVYEILDYDEEYNQVVQFLKGNFLDVKKRLKARMWQQAHEHHYEQAARLRDQYRALEVSFRPQSVHNVNLKTDLDLCGMAHNETFVVITHGIWRSGRLLGMQPHILKNNHFPMPMILMEFLEQYYEKNQLQLPKEILIPVEIKEKNWIQSKLICPKKGHKKSLIVLANQNAQEYLEKEIHKKQSSQTALEALQQLLQLKALPSVIECMDVSLFQGADAVASKICFVDGTPKKEKYRRYHIKTVEGTDDYAMLREVIERRLKRGLSENDLPHLLLIDGGKGQLAVALAVCKDLGITVSKEEFYVAGIAKARTLKAQHKTQTHIEKTKERLFLPNVKDPIVLKSGSKVGNLIEQIRDEAHRFAITFHRQKRARRLTKK